MGDLVVLLACALAAPALSAAEAKPALMLANVYHPGVKLQNYSVGKNTTAFVVSGMATSC